MNNLLRLLVQLNQTSAENDPLDYDSKQEFASLQVSLFAEEAFQGD